MTLDTLRGAFIEKTGETRSPLDSDISRNVRQRSVGQTVQKLQAIWSYLDFIHDGAPAF